MALNYADAHDTQTERVVMGGRYENDITPNRGYTFKSSGGTRLYIQVTMGGYDITDDVTSLLVGDNGIGVNIPKVVGNVVITTSTTPF